MGQCDVKAEGWMNTFPLFNSTIPSSLLFAVSATHMTAPDIPSIRKKIPQVRRAVERLPPEPGSSDPLILHGRLRPNKTLLERLGGLIHDIISRLSPRTISREQAAKATIRQFEDSLWTLFGMTGTMVPEVLLEECKMKLRQCTGNGNKKHHAGEQVFDSLLTDDKDASTTFFRECLDALNLIHRQRKLAFKFATRASSTGHPSYRDSVDLLSLPSKATWTPSKSVPPCEFRTNRISDFGRHFWLLAIGNNNYPGSPLSGCINDAMLVQNYSKEYLGVPPEHIRVLKNATRQNMIDALYDLRDNDNIQRGDNILIHYSGHGTSYDPDSYFTTAVAKAGSIEALCPVDRGRLVPDISDRELNSILNELQKEKGENVTLFFDCCHSGGGARDPSAKEDYGTRYISPLAFRMDDHPSDLHAMLEAADTHPRRREDTPLTSDETWFGSVNGFVQLAACQDFQTTTEGVFEVDLASDSTQPSTISLPYTVDEGYMESKSDFQSTRGLMVANTKGSSKVPMAGPAVTDGASSYSTRRKKYGRFTWALINCLKSNVGQTGTYEDVIESIGQFSDLQVPVAVGTRTASRLWFEDFNP